MAQISVLDATGDPVSVELPNTNGRQAASGSRPVALSTEDKAALDALVTALGEVQASPSANTVLARLKTIADALATLAGHVDGLETLATALNGYVDGLEGLLGTTNSSLSTMIGHVDGIESGLVGKATEAKQDAILAALGSLATESSLADLASGLGDAATETTLASILSALGGTLAVSGPLTDTQLRASPVEVDGSGVTQPVSADSLPLPTGAATEAKQDEATAAIAALRGTNYETVAASQSDQVLGATGAAGDLLESLLVIPASLSPGAVQIKDGSGAAITVFAGGSDSVTTLHPFAVPLGIRSASGAWSVTTGANVSVVASGAFT